MKKKVLFICLHRPDRSPSQRFRFEQYLDFLQEEDFDCQHVYLLNQKQDKAFYAQGKYLQKAMILIGSVAKLIQHTFFKKYDITFVQREAFMLGTSFFERQMAKRSKLIYDLDDAIWKQQTGEIKSKNQLFYFLKNPNKTQEIIQSAAMIFAGNQYIADYASSFNTNVKIIPTTIDMNVYQPVPTTKDDPVCIGWSGSFSTIIHFEHVLDALVAVKEKYGDKVYFSVVGDDSFRHEKLGIEGKQWTMAAEMQDLSEIDIGIMPLPDDEWTKGKCGLKGLQYMALGIPTIMSPVGVNTEIIEEGVSGYFAMTNTEWVEKISLLVDDAASRKIIGDAGKKVVADRYSSQSQEQAYLKYFKELVG